MSLSANLLLAATALFCFSTMFAFPWEGRNRYHCRCLNTTNTYINPRSFAMVEVIPSRETCNDTEIIVILKVTRQKVCLDPEAGYVQRFLKKVLWKWLKQESPV